MPRYLLLLLLVISCLTPLIGGCGDASEGLTIAPGAPPTVARPGSARLARLVTDATVEVVVDGERFGPEVRVGSDGTFRLPEVPNPCRVIMRVPGGPTLSAEVRSGARDWLWIGPVTTMVSRYLQTHPDVSLEVATQRVTDYLGIPAGVDIGSGLGDSHRSPFSWSQLVAAAGATPIDAFLDQQVALVGQGGTISFRQPAPYPALRAMLGHQQAGAPAGVRAQAGDSGSFLVSVGGNILADVATDGISDLVGWVGEALGLNFGKAAQLTAIESDLTTIMNEITALGLEVQDDFNELSDAVAEDTTKEQITTVQGVLGPVTTRIQSQVQLYQEMLATVPSKVDTPFVAPPAIATQFATSLHNYANASSSSLGEDISALRQSMLGLNHQPNLPMLYATLIQQALGNTTPQGSNLFCDLRSNAILQREQDFLDFYRAHQVLALLLTAEASHLDNETFSLGGSNANQMATNTQEASQTLRQMSSDLVLEQQQVPPATLASDDVIVDRLQEVMYYNTMQNGPTYVDSGSVYEYTLSFSLGPWGSGNWKVASLANVDALRSYALAAGNGNPVTGLQRMGFQLPQTASTDISLLVINGSVFQQYSMATGNTSEWDADAGLYYNYLMVRDAPGTTGTIVLSEYNSGLTGGSPEDAGTLRALAPPSALMPGTDPDALDLMGTLTYTSHLDSLFINVNSDGDREPEELTFPVTETSTIDYTTSASWASSDTASLDVSNLPGTQGQITYHTDSVGETQVVATLLSHFVGQASAPPTPVYLTQAFTSSQLPGTPTTPVLQSILVTPNNNIYTVTTGSPASASAYCYATGFYSDGTVQDLTALVAWSVVTSPISGAGTPQASASFDFLVANLLRMPQLMGISSMAITATYQGVTGTAQSETDFFE